MTRILTAAIAILVLGAAAVASLSTAGAQSEIDVRVNNARSDFPNGIVFNLTAATAGGLDEVRLIYKIAPDGVRASAVPQCTGEAVASCRFDLLASPRNLLIPGAQVTYFWQLTSGDLSEETAPQEVLYEDSRFEWRSLTDGNLTVWWYSGSEDEARGILTAGQGSADRHWRAAGDQRRFSGEDPLLRFGGRHAGRDHLDQRAGRRHTGRGGLLRYSDGLRRLRGRRNHPP